MSATRQEAYQKIETQSKWWCPHCSCYRLPKEVKVKETRNATDWDDFTDYTLVCGECNRFVREPDPTNCKEVMINFVDGMKWEDVRSQLDTDQINGFSLVCGEWKLGHLSQEVKKDYEDVLALKDVNRLSEFLLHWNDRSR